MAKPTISHPSASSAFTVVELLVAIAILATLSGLTVAGINTVRNASRTAIAQLEISNLHGALLTYRLEQGRYPDPEPDRFMRIDTKAYFPNADERSRGIKTVGTTTVLSLLSMKSDTRLANAIPDPANPQYRIAVDPWGRPYRYDPDLLTSPDEPVKRPHGAVVDDWNTKLLADGTLSGDDIFPYVYSLGKPELGTADALSTTDPDDTVANLTHWIYHRNQMSAP